MSNMRCSTDPYNPTLMVDKMIGSAYPTVKKVADELPLLNYISENMANLQNIAEDLAVDVQVNGVSGSIGSTVQLPLPAGMTTADMLSMCVLILPNDHAAYGVESGHFTAFVSGGSLQVTLDVLAPALLENAPILWSIRRRA